MRSYDPPPKNNLPSISVGIPITVDETELVERGVPSGEEMRKNGSWGEFPVLYMEPRALAFLRAWPDVPPVLRPAYSRFQDAGLMFVDPEAPPGMSWPGPIRLTALGHRVREVMIGKTINFFRMVDVLALMPTQNLYFRDPVSTYYLHLWKIYEGGADHPVRLYWDNADMKRYVAQRMQGYDPTSFKGLVPAEKRLKAAIERLTFHVNMLTWRTGDTEDEINNPIPF